MVVARNRRLLASCVGAPLVLAALLLPGAARAEQFVLFDVTFTYTWEDAMNSSPSQSHYYVNDENVLNTERPDDWLSPVDYRNGTLHVRLEVLDKPPGDQTANWTLCYIANEGGYGCAQTGVYTAEGVFESDVGMTSWWNNEVIDWTQGIRQMDLIYKKSTEGLDHVHFFPELEELVTPTTVRITMIQVSAGAEYDPNLVDLDFGGAGGAGNEGGAAGTGGMGEAGAAMGGAAGADTSIGGTSGAAMGGAAAEVPQGGAGAAGAPTVPETPAEAGSTAVVPTPPPMGNAGTPAVAPSTPSTSSESAACSLRQRAQNFAGVWLAGLGALALLLRRRKSGR